jgi:hydrophobic/amphiphilic exporter-1 (mainly G- bacteria), HAE1 family
MSIFELSIRRPVFISTVIIVLVVFGIVAYPKIGIDFFPGMEPPVATVLTIYPGAGPETVESEVTKPLEDALSELSGIDQLKSTSVENVSQVAIIFDLDEDADQAIQDVRDKVSRAAALLPEKAETPTVERLDLGAEPILTLVLSGSGKVSEVTELAKKRLKEPLQAVTGVGSVDIIGGAEKEIKVWVDPLKLEAAGLAVTDLIGVLGANNLEFPGGRFKSEGSELTVRVDGDLDTLEEIADLPVLDVGGRVVRVRDVARVEAGIEEKRSSALTDGKSTVTLLVRKQSGTNAVAVAKAVKERFAGIQEKLPEGWSARIVSDQTRVTKASFDAVWFDMIFGGVLAVLIVFVFLRNLRSTFIAALALPVSVVGTFAFIWLMGFTFNILTMLALTLSIGLLIDDAIVVIENIYRHMELGKSAREAALDGAKEIALAVLATTLSIVAVFLPAALTGGIIGMMLYEFGMTVVVAVLISLVVSFTLTPMLSARILGEQRSNPFYRLIEWFLDGIDSMYRRIIGWALRHRVVVLGLAVAVFAGTIYSARYINTEFAPSLDRGLFNVYVKLPPGTSLEKTEQRAAQIAKRIGEQVEEVTATIVKVGADAQQSQNKAEILVTIVDKQARAATHLQLVDRVREMLKDIRDAEVSVKDPDIAGGGGGAMGGAIVQYNLKGSDLDLLGATAGKMMAELEQIPGLADLTMSFEGGKPEMQLVIDHERAAGLGVPTAMVGQTVNALVGGRDVSKFKEGAEEYDIQVRLDEKYRQTPGQFSGLKVRSTTSNRLVDLGSLSRLEPRSGPTQIDRESRQRQITISANLTGALPLSRAQKIVEQVAARVVPDEVTTDWGGQARMMGKSMNELAVSMILAVILVYMVLAAQFESWLHPLTIMMSLPLSVIGAFIAVLATGGTMSVISMIGMLMLMGLVTKNAILLVDYTNTLRRRDGMSRTEALLKAGSTRLRPILMTTLAMVFGMIPVAISKGWGAEARAPMAVAVIGGLVASTLLTLVVVPVVYTLVDAVGAFLSRLVHLSHTAEELPQPATEVSK